MTVQNIIAPDTSTDTPAIEGLDPLWETSYQEGDEFILKATYQDDTVRLGRAKYIGPHLNPTPIEGTNEHLTIPLFEAVGNNNPLIAGYAKYYKILRSL